MFPKTAEKSSAGWSIPGPGKVHSVLLCAMVCLFVVAYAPSTLGNMGSEQRAFQEHEQPSTGNIQAVAWLVAAASDKYGAPLRFDAPPVDLPDESRQQIFPRAQRPGQREIVIPEEDEVLFAPSPTPKQAPTRKPEKKETENRQKKSLGKAAPAPAVKPAISPAPQGTSSPETVKSDEKTKEAVPVTAPSKAPNDKIAQPEKVVAPKTAEPQGKPEPREPPAKAEPVRQDGLKEGVGTPETPAKSEPQTAEGEGQPKEQDAKKAKKPIRLFGTVEFRGTLKNMPKWQRVLNAEKKAPTFGTNEDKTMPAKVLQNWRSLKEKIKDKSLMEQAKAVNVFFNQWPYKTDLALYGVTDYWATPQEFLKKSGDCEDYAITKYYAMRSLGVPAKQLRIVALKDTIRNLGHAVLVVFVNDNAYVLDNLSQMLIVHSRLKHYAPQYSVNEDYRWAHVVPLN